VCGWTKPWVQALDQPVPEGWCFRPAVVSDVEYQGTYVLLGLQSPAASHHTQATAEASAMLSEAQFASCAFTVGQSVHMVWRPEAAHPLEAVPA